jgi:hypothetical protein
MKELLPLGSGKCGLLVAFAPLSGTTTQPLPIGDNWLSITNRNNMIRSVLVRRIPARRGKQLQIQTQVFVLPPPQARQRVPRPIAVFEKTLFTEQGKAFVRELKSILMRSRFIGAFVNTRQHDAAHADRAQGSSSTSLHFAPT